MKQYSMFRRLMSLTLLMILHASLFTPHTLAQDEPEYRMEVGGGLGLQGYLGDFNSSLMKDMQPAVSLVARYKSNPRWGWAVNLTTGKIKGGSDGTDTWYPDMQSAKPDEDRMPPYQFSNQLMDLGMRYEYNFWPFGTGREYLGAKPLTPFFALGAGLTFAKPNNGDATVGFQFPIGAGVKYKLTDRLNLAAEWMMHFTGTDGLDGLKDPYGIESSGLFKNTDSYSVLRLTLTYDIWEKCKTCMNDRD
jgi:hypothetical protein